MNIGLLKQPTLIDYEPQRMLVDPIQARGAKRPVLGVMLVY